MSVIVFEFVLGVNCLGPTSSSWSSAASGFGENELRCQAASVTLAECCPGFDPRGFLCDGAQFESTSYPGCGSGGAQTRTVTTYPSLSASESLCVQQEPCATLLSTGVCARATRRAAFGPHIVSTGSGIDADTSPGPPDDPDRVVPALVDTGSARDAGVADASDAATTDVADAAFFRDASGSEAAGSPPAPDAASVWEPLCP